MKKLLLSLAMLSLLAGCTTDPYTGESKLSNTAGGAGLGAAGGALGGYLIGRATGVNSGTAALVGAGVGALAGGGIGAYLDNQEAELRGQLRGTGVSVTRTGNSIVLNMPSNITFPTDGDQILPAFGPVLNSVAIVLRKYDRSLVEVAGHTDNVGSPSYNLDLSRRRALSVADYLSGQGIDGRRLDVRGYGMTRPVAENRSESGRAENRRVEITIIPNDGGGAGDGYGRPVAAY
ncbi:cell envelope biogenesis protein OmpA [Aureimonas endophytica]|uniref:Cell envelope biogenesis protein OmpA n=1 Tax=Aureimonas endophytica TaxID=2027858 RepID=A0A916ZRQ4_9HYPH|nr:OmpA family protein [Aureimonas endophytica]GGE08177.1 cell envelope biogenesis protein OmpA [Aureimonas endophytica]